MVQVRYSTKQIPIQVQGIILQNPIVNGVDYINFQMDMGKNMGEYPIYHSIPPISL